jgi:hypothetical protein
MKMTNKEKGLKIVQDLVSRFAEHLIAYKKADYNETQTRRDFIDPFFKALGWDIDNEQGFSESYREVIHEDKIKISGGTKAPDYSFRLSGKEKLFFLEAKKPNIKIKEFIDPAYQIRRYGWNAKMTISVLTDFEELSIYDCTNEPKSQDSAAKARLNYITYDRYEKEWEFLWNVLSKESAQNGGFNEYLKKVPLKKGADTVDKKFLKSLDEWRTLLAETISKENKQLDEDELNFAVQQTLDRIIFLRICEDRSIEPYGRLKECLNHGNYYENLLSEFKQADQKYNSGLFNFKKDKISHQLKINNKTLKTIISQLYYPECPYEFSVISVEILGSAYEQFLGKTITINNRGKAAIELKPEVRKAGGVYYTPQYIVDYAVKNTIGKLCDKKTPTEVAEIKIVDPACGSGSFLIGAYQFLLDWHKNYYTSNGKISKGSKDNPLTPDGNLTTAEKKRILLNNIFGVDIDANAVEVTKLSLLLKCMEGETQASINHQLKMFQERVLPTLDNNIRDGNSLVETDFYEGRLDFDEERKIKPFSWKNSFPDIFKNGGFDVAIGNPPYVAIEGINQTERDYFSLKYPNLKKRLDLFGLFTDKGLRLLNRNGKLGFIIPMQFLRNSAFELLRKSILENNYLEEINYVGDKVFEDANNDTIILIIGKEEKKGEKSTLIESTTTKTSIIEKKVTSVEQNSFLKNQEFIIDLSSSDNKKIFSKIEKQKLKIKERFKVIQGIVSGLNGAYIYKNNEVPKIEKKLLKTFVFGSDFEKYFLRNPQHQIIYINRHIDIKNLPNTEAVLKPHKKQLDKRREVINGAIPWYSLQWAREQSSFERPKIMFQKIRNQKLPQRLVGTYDENGLFVGDGVIFLNSNTDSKDELKFLLAVLNSTLYNFYYREQFLDINLKIKYLEETSVVDFNNFSKEDAKLFSEIVNLVEQLIILNEEKSEIKLHTKVSQIESKIKFSEERINQVVYQLYGLTKEEIKIVEST